MNNNFPVDPNLNISAFSRILDNTTNSYKYLFFLSFIRKIKDIGKSELAISEIKLIDLAVEMLLFAWFPHRYFRLSLGVRDQCANILNKFVESQNRVFENGPITDNTLGQLRMELFEWLTENQNHLITLLRYVPFRLLSPFYEWDLRGVPDAQRNTKIKLLANESTIENISLYKFTSDSILIDACWREYIQKNIPIIEGWVNWHWCEYLQNKNLSVPSIPKKILPILGKISLTKERAYWQDVLAHKELRCIYTSKELGSFELDHFLPWTFVTYNKLWNLIPVIGAANSSKSNTLPSLFYLDDFIKEQASAIQISKMIYPEKKWEKIMEPYIADLNVACYDDLLDETILDKAYRSTIMPLYEIARSNGFSSGWAYRENKIDIIGHDLLIEPILLDEIDEEEKYVSFLPFYPIEIAAGNFAESEVVEEPCQWLDISKTDYSGVLSNDLFISQVHGHSMESLIPDGSYCLFKYGVVGSRNNRVLLVKKDGVIDPDLQTSFTVKRYFSEKIIDSEFEWAHQKIELKPDNQEYPVLVIEPDNAEDFFVVAEFIQVIV
jgi:hypothetical protein